MKSIHNLLIVVIILFLNSCSREEAVINPELNIDDSSVGDGTVAGDGTGGGGNSDEFDYKSIDNLKSTFKTGSCVNYSLKSGGSEMISVKEVKSFDGSCATLKDTIDINGTATESESKNCFNAPACEIKEEKFENITVKAGTFTNAKYTKTLCNGVESSIWYHKDIPAGMIAKLVSGTTEMELAKYNSNGSCYEGKKGGTGGNGGSGSGSGSGSAGSGGSGSGGNSGSGAGGSGSGGTGAENSKMVVSPTSLNFSTSVDSGYSKIIEITNPTNVILKIIEAVIDGADKKYFKSNFNPQDLSCTSIASNKKCSIMITFTPPDNEDKIAKLIIKSSNSENPTAEIELNGKTYSDTDGDGIENSKDACPLDYNQNENNNNICSSSYYTFKPNGSDPNAEIYDEDGDNAEAHQYIDNCPTLYNKTQMDSDEDGTGDVCDSTPGEATVTGSEVTNSINYLFGSWVDFGIYHKEKDSTKWKKIFATKSAEKIVFGDIDGDGIDDPIAVMTDADTKRKIFAKFSTKSYSTVVNWDMVYNIAPDDLVACDINNDKKEDIIANWNPPANNPGVWLRNGAYGAWTKIAPNMKKIACGDINNDGKKDLLGINSDNNIHVIYSITLDEEGVWAPLFKIPSQDLTICDMNGDSMDDLVLSKSLGGIIYKYKDASTNTYKESSIYTSSAKAITCGDLDGDGKGDVSGIWHDGFQYIHYSKTNKWEKAEGTNPTSIAIGKVNLSIFQTVVQ